MHLALLSSIIILMLGMITYILRDYQISDRISIYQVVELTSEGSCLNFKFRLMIQLLNVNKFIVKSYEIGNLQQKGKIKFSI